MVSLFTRCQLLFTDSGIPRVEKYRPNVLDDVVGNIDTIERLKVIAKDGNCPHIIISVRNTCLSLSLVFTFSQGMPGIGKNYKHTLFSASATRGRV